MMMDALTVPISNIIRKNEKRILVRMEKELFEKSRGQESKSLGSSVWKKTLFSFIDNLMSSLSALCIRVGGQTEFCRRKSAYLLEYKIKIAWIVIPNFESNFLGVQAGGAQQFDRLFDALPGQILDKCFAGLATEDHTEVAAT